MNITNLAKLGSGLHESPTVMFEDNNNIKLGKNRGILKPSWAFVDTKSFNNYVKNISCNDAYNPNIIIKGILGRNNAVILFKCSNLIVTF